MVPSSRLVAAAAMCLSVSVGTSAAPDARLKSDIKASIERGTVWLCGQINAQGNWNGDVYLTADAVRVLAGRPRPFVDDPALMRQPVAFLRTALERPALPIMAATIVLGLAPLGEVADRAAIRAQAPVLVKWIADTSTMTRPVDAGQLASMVAAARAAGVERNSKLVEQVAVLTRHAQANGPVPGLAESLRISALLSAGASKRHELVKIFLEQLRKDWGWWRNEASVRKMGYPAVPPRLWQALANALDALGSSTFTDAKGASHDWRVELARETIKGQRPDGSWIETTDALGATTAALSALEIIYR